YVEDDTPAIDKPPSVDETLTKEERILQLVTWVVMAINERDASVVSNQDLQDLPEKEDVIVVPDVETPVLPGTPVQPSISEAQRLRIANQGKLATVSSMIYTTQKAVNYSFYGVREVDVLQQVLLSLQQANIKATFFVSSDDLTRYDVQIKQIVAAGHELQMIIKESDGTTYESVANDLLWMKATIQSRYGQQAKYVRYAYDRIVETEVLEAISATGCAFVQHTLAIARSNIDQTANASIIYNELSNTGTTALKRGELVYFRMDYYKDPTVIAQLVTSIKVGKVDPIAYFGQGGYSFTTIKDLNDSTMRYQLLDGSVALPVAFGKADTSVQQIQQRYIGNPDIDAGNVLPGFSEEELLGLDTVGKLKLQAQPTMYLTFDDWGSDAAINKLLFVLDKYQVKATFFVRTNYVQTNPNLLRAIAEAGHTIASHTDNHLVLSNYVTGSDPSQYLDLTAEEAKALQSDVVTSYRKLYEIVGDTNALSTIFRPPTLAVGKTGMKAVLDVGYTYLISGDYSTKDYEATSAQVFIDGFHTAYQNQQVGDGSVVVMHMSDTAEYTAEGLDTILPSYLAQGYSFKRVVEGVN
ncbi:MAG: polysaccharide deacetylase family protein, partial [Erysipelotrichaceae bacterium]